MLARVTVGVFRFHVEKRPSLSGGTQPSAASAVAVMMQASRQSQKQFLTEATVSSWFKEEGNRGRLASDLSVWMEDSGFCFTDQDQPTRRERRFKRILAVVWSISPSLKKSLTRDLERASADVQPGVDSMWHRAGHIRTGKDSRDGSLAALLEAIQAAESNLPSR